MKLVERKNPTAMSENRPTKAFWAQTTATNIKAVYHETQWTEFQQFRLA